VATVCSRCESFGENVCKWEAKDRRNAVGNDYFECLPRLNAAHGTASEVALSSGFPSDTAGPAIIGPATDCGLVSGRSYRRSPLRAIRLAATPRSAIRPAIVSIVRPRPWLTTPPTTNTAAAAIAGAVGGSSLMQSRHLGAPFLAEKRKR
jgi:hypothetical protein